MPRWYVNIQNGCGNILGINFFLFWELIFFFLWFQLEVETFQVGVGCLCRGGRAKKKKSWWGVGGEGAAPPPQMHSQNMLCDSPSVRMILGPWVHNFLFGVLDSYNFRGLRFIKDLVLCSKTCRFLTEFFGPEVFLFCVLCLYIFLVVSGS